MQSFISGWYNGCEIAPTILCATNQGLYNIDSKNGPSVWIISERIDPQIHAKKYLLLGSIDMIYEPVWAAEYKNKHYVYIFSPFDPTNIAPFLQIFETEKSNDNYIIQTDNVPENIFELTEFGSVEMIDTQNPVWENS